MAFAQRIIPADSDILCERCGYTLNHLPEENNCPECGEPIAHSRSQDGRSLSLYESDPRPATFWKTTFQVIFQTKRFYRTLAGRVETLESVRFAVRCRQLASLAFSICGIWHAVWIVLTSNVPFQLPHLRNAPLYVVALLLMPFVFPMTFFALLGTIRLAEWLTALEARFWGIRLPHRIVRRAMNFHSANYLVVAAIATMFVGFHQATRLLPDMWYLYILCGLVVASAIYLFQTYWIGMKNLMYANR